MNQLYEKKKIQTFKSYSIKKNKLRSYIFYFTAILTACILLVTLATYYQMSKESEKLIIDTQSSTLVNFGSVIDSMVLTNIENVALTVLSDDELYQKMFYEPLHGNNINIPSINRKLRSLMSMNPIIYEIALYYKKNSLIVTSKGMRFNDIMTPRSFFDFQWVDMMEVNQNSAGWLKTREIHERAPTKVSELNAVTYFRKFPLTGTDYLGGVCITINETALHEKIVNTVPETFQSLFIIDHSGFIVSHSDKELIRGSIFDLEYGKALYNETQKNKHGYFTSSLGGQKVVVSYTQSSKNDWIYVSVNYIDKLSENYKFIYNIIIYFAAAMLLFGISTLLLTTNRMGSANVKLQNMSAKIVEQESEITKNQNIVKLSFYNNLIDGIYMRDEEICEQLALLHISFVYKFYSAVTIKIFSTYADARAIEFVKLKSIEHIDKRFDNLEIGCICTSKRNNIMLLLGSESGQYSDLLKDTLLGICGYIFNEHGLKSCIGIGDFFEKVSEISVAYRQSRIALDYSYFFYENKIISYHDVLHLEASKNVPPTGFSVNFKAALSAKNKNDAMQIVRELAKDIVAVGYPFNRSKNMILSICMELENYAKQLERQGVEIVKPDLYYEVMRTDTIDEYIELVDKTLDDLFEENVSVHRNTDMIEKVKLYINSNIQKENLSLNSIAEYMHITPNYLSRIFKEETGMYFIDYITDVRLEMSKNLLLCTDMPLEEIAFTTGYSSTQYYSKKFKSRYGITPKQFRNQNV